MQLQKAHQARLRVASNHLRVSPPARRLRRPLLVVSASTNTGDSSSSNAPTLQQSVARTAALGLTAAALGLALFQGRAQAAASAPVAKSTQVVRQTTTPPAAVMSPAAVRPLDTAGNANEALQYRVMQLFAAPTYGKIFAVFAFAAPILVLASVLYHQTAKGATWKEAIIRPTGLLMGIPGYSVHSNRSPAADIVLHCVFLVGLFTFAAVFGFVCSDIRTEVLKVRRGHHTVYERHHTVILGWNKQLLPVLQQMALARADSAGALFSGPVVVLAEEDKEWMDDTVADELEGYGLNVITRTGSPAKPSDQARVAAAQADTVVLLWPTDKPAAEASAQTAAALSALRATGGMRGQKVVVQSRSDALKEFNATKIAVGLAQASPGGKQVATLLSSGYERTHDMLAQVANQPGLEEVFADLLEYEQREQDSSSKEDTGAEFYCLACPAHLEGKSYQTVRLSFPRATVIGWVSGVGGSLHLNSRDTTIVQPGSQLVFVARGVDDTLAALPEPYEVSSSSHLGRKRAGALPARNITCLCFEGPAAPSVLKSMAEFSGKGSNITLVASDLDHSAIKSLKLRGINVNLVDGNPSSLSVLNSKAAHLQDADAVVVCGLGSQPAAAADVQVLASVLQLQSIAAEQQRDEPLPVVAALHEPSSNIEDVLWHTTLSYHADLKAEAATKAAAELERMRTHAKKTVSPDELAAVSAAASADVTPPVSLHLLRPSELKAGMITQTAVAPQLADVFGELFQANRHELYLRDPRTTYGLPLGKPLLWKDIAEVARRQGDTAIGFTRMTRMTAGGSMQLGHGSEPHLGVVADSELTLGPGDKLVVVALN